MLTPIIKNIFAVSLSLLILCVYSLPAQDKKNALSDTSKIALPDSSKIDTAKVKKGSDINAIVYSTANDSMIMNINSKKMQIYGKGSIKYKKTDLKGGKIFVDYNTNELEAYGTPDSTGKNLKDTPVLNDGGQVYEGERMRYNFKTEQGFISIAKNKEKDTRYEGEKVKKVDKETYFIESGTFTTCSEKEPHTHFSASKMKVMIDNKIIAKWVFMYIAGIPLPIPLPMAVIPNQTGRRSGIIMPGYGDDTNRGLYLSHLGYFFALSDYYDLALTTDLYSRGGFGMKSRVRYNKRYEFSGEFNAGFSNTVYDAVNNKEWSLTLTHNQKITPTSTLAANLQFQSATYNTYNTTDYTSLMQQQVISNATYSNTFEDLGASLSLSYSRTQNLAKGTYTENLPSLNFSKTLFYPFKRSSKSGVIDQKWYELIGVNYSASLENRRVKTDTTLTENAGIKHYLTINASPKFGYFTVTPSFTYTERWYNKRTEKDNLIHEVTDSNGTATTLDSIVSREARGFYAVRTFSLGVSASTKLYGVMPAGFLGIEAFRHTISPTISYNYTPDFSQGQWGYYGSYVKKDGTIVKYDKYANEIYGGSGSGESQYLSFSVGNIFELKTIKDENDTTSQAKKIQLLNFSVSSGYNFAGDSLKLSNLSTSFRTQIGELLDFNGSAIYSFYDTDNNGNSVNKYLASEGKGLFRITSFNFSVSTSISAEKLKSSGGEKGGDKQTVNEGNMNTPKSNADPLNSNSESSADYSIPWNLSLSFNYNSTSNPVTASVRSSSMGANFSMNLTKKWKVSLAGSYDFESRQVSAPQIGIDRDLHCWEMKLTWRPLGLYKGFYFIIRMKASEFQDIKVEKTGGLFSGLR